MAKRSSRNPDHYRRRHFAQRAADSGWSVRNLEAEIIRDQARPARAAPHPDPIAAAATLEDTMTRALGIGIRTSTRRNGYQLLWGQAGRDRLRPAAAIDGVHPMGLWAWAV